jgi:hypothetical protein
MIQFMRAGGFPIWIVLLFGLITLVVAGLFVWRPDERKHGMLRGMTMATQYSIWTALFSCLAAVMFKVPQTPEWAKSPDLPLIVMTGIGESLTPCILGFTILSLAWLLGAVGKRRLPDRLQ